jgi:cytoplasmic iron level regulating protein YaaA (DUF328/UPF0246 family)
MKKIILISCVSKKRNIACKARELYQSTLFKLSLAYAETLNADHIFILSALHGVVELDSIIEPYNITLNNMSEKDKKDWAQKVMVQLKDKGIDFEQDQIIFLAGNNYRKHLICEFKKSKVPMKGLRIGEQLSFLKERNSYGR